MASDYPYMMSNNKIAPILEQIEKAEKPPKFTYEFLKRLGFSSSNDRAIIPLFKKLGFLRDDGSPTEHYDGLRDPSTRPYVLGEQIRDLYSDLFAIDTEIHKRSDEKIKGAVSRVTGEEATAVTRLSNTFKTLVGLAKFNSRATAQQKEPLSPADSDSVDESESVIPDHLQLGTPDFHYNIQIHLPATTEVSVYNAIFKSLKDNLLI